MLWYMYLYLRGSFLCDVAGLLVYLPVSCRFGGLGFSADRTTGSGPIPVPTGSGMSEMDSGPRPGLKAEFGESGMGSLLVSGCTAMGSSTNETGSGPRGLGCSSPGTVSDGTGLVTAAVGSEYTGTGSGPRGLVRLEVGPRGMDSNHS